MNKKIWENFGAQQFANSIATKAPKISFPKNKLLQKEWDNLSKNNNILKTNYLLAYNSSIDGWSYLGIKRTSKNDLTPLLFVGKPGWHKIKDGKMVSLVVIIDDNNQNVTETYNLEQNTNSYSRQFQLNNVISSIDFPLITKNIPWSCFFANPRERKDFDNVPVELIDDWIQTIDLMKTDALVSKGLTMLNTPQMAGTTDNINKLKEALLDPKAVVYENTNIFSMLQQGGINILQGVSNQQSLNEKLKTLENKIKQFAFLKKETTDLGTKNLQSSETELLNSDADDYIELKANLMELQWEHWIRTVFFDYLKEVKKITTDIVNAEIDVEVLGSTKFLQNKANKYVQNQQGILTNPNDIDKGENNGKYNRQNFDKERIHTEDN